MPADRSDRRDAARATLLELILVGGPYEGQRADFEPAASRLVDGTHGSIHYVADAGSDAEFAFPQTFTPNQRRDALMNWVLEQEG